MLNVEWDNWYIANCGFLDKLNKPDELNKPNKLNELNKPDKYV